MAVDSLKAYFLPTSTQFTWGIGVKCNNSVHNNKRALKYVLGHRNIRNTMIYIQIEKQLFQEAPEDFISRVAETVEEACELIEVGFEYVGRIHGAEIFRKRR